MNRAVIFDIDGTLIDSVDLHAECWVEALREFDVEVTAERMHHEIGKGGDQLLPLFLSPERLAREGEAIAAFRADLFKRSYLPHVKAFAAVPELFARLRASGRRIALASSGKADEIKVYARIAGISELVDVAISADDAARSKPAPDIFRATLTALAPIPAEACLAIGDTPWDVIAAKGAGLGCVGVLSGGFGEAELRAAGAVAIYRDPADLLARIAASPLFAE